MYYRTLTSIAFIIMELQNIPPHILEQLDLAQIRIPFVPFRITEPKRAEAKPFAMQALARKMYCIGIDVTMFETLSIEQPVGSGTYIADTNKAVTPERTDRDSVQLRISRVDDTPISLAAEGSTILQGIDIFSLVRLTQSGLFPGFIIPRRGELKFDLIHDYEGQRAQLQFPIFGKIHLLGYNFLPSVE